eukprot:1154344-Pelagomonas_calceolata.AAC.12
MAPQLLPLMRGLVCVVALQPAAGQQKLQPEGKKGSGPAGHRSSSPGWTSYPTGVRSTANFKFVKTIGLEKC